MTEMDIPNGLPESVATMLRMFAEAAAAGYGENLVSIVLYGSAAERQMRQTSDVNILAVLKIFDLERANKLREPLRLARAAVAMNVMFILESELHDAMEAFAVKFADIKARHYVVLGTDPFASDGPSPLALLRRLDQVLLNYQLRLRERYVLMSLRAEQLDHVIADAAGPLRSCAAAILALEKRPAASPKAALETIARESGDHAFAAALADIGKVRSGDHLLAGEAAQTISSLMRLTKVLRDHAARLHD